MTEQVDKSSFYDGFENVPPLVLRSIELSRDNDFPFSCTPYQGELLKVLARGRNGGVIGETGTGYGAGLAWMLSAVGPETKFVSIERDEARAAACQELFAPFENVTILQGDWHGIIPHAPFDLLVLDGGGGAKRPGDEPANVSALLNVGGTVVLDDFHPPIEGWPPANGGEGADNLGRDINYSRAAWFDHPDLLTTEFRVHPLVSAVVGTRRGIALANRPA